MRIKYKRRNSQLYRWRNSNANRITVREETKRVFLIHQLRYTYRTLRDERDFRRE